MRTKLPLVALLILTFAIRMLHLLNPGHYFLIGTDSFYFHKLAASSSIPFFGSGLAYPLRWLTNINGNLDAMSALLPPLLSVITALLIYCIVADIYGRRVALFSVLCYAVVQPVFYFGLAGNIDRDILSILLVTGGILLIRRFGTIRATIPCAILLAILWSWIGAAVLLLIVIAISVIVYIQVHRDKVRLLWQSGPLVVLGLLGVGLYHRTIYNHLMVVVHNRDIAELQMLNSIDILGYLFIGLPLVAGIYIMFNAARDRGYRAADLMLVTWIAACLGMGLIAARLAIFMGPAVCIIAGIGLARLAAIPQRKPRAVMMILVAVSMLMSVSLAWSLPRNAVMSRDWHDALTYIEAHTAPEDHVLSWWDYGFWIEDVGGCQSLANNKGGKLCGESVDRRIAMTYCADSDIGALQSATGWCNDEFPYLNPKYIIFSTREDEFWSTITKQVGYDNPNCLYRQVFRSDYYSDILPIVYSNGTVRVLELT